MQLVFIEVSKYIFAFLLCFYAAAAYRGAVMKEEKRKFTYAFQNVILKETGVSRQTFYNHFKDKNDLICYVYDTFIGLFDTLSA